MSNPPKPIELKRKLGNPGKQTLPKENETILIAAIDEIPVPHRQLFDRLGELAERDPRANAWNDTKVMARLQELGIDTTGHAHASTGSVRASPTA